MKRRNFVKKTAISGLAGALIPFTLRAAKYEFFPNKTNELSYNGTSLLLAAQEYELS